LRGGAGGLLHIGGHAFQLLLGGVIGPSLGRVQRVLAELLRQLGQPFVDGRVTLPGRALQLGPAQHEIAQRVLVRLPLRGVERGGGDGLVLGVQALVGAQARPELGHAGQGGVVGGAQLRRIGHGLKMPHRAPRARQALGGHIQRAADGLPFSGKAGLRHRVQRAFRLGQERIDGGVYVFRPDPVKRRQAGEVEQGVGGR